MIYFDVTKTCAARQKSGLTRVAGRLLQELGDAVVPVVWEGGFREGPARARVRFQPDDWLVTAELFSEAERPGFSVWVGGRECRLAAVFHDAIPLKFPHITWPQSVQRHPGYMKLLAGFDRVLAVSEESRKDLEGFWRWQGVTPQAQTGVIALGADFDGGARVGAEAEPAAPGRPAVLCVGILEPRKNQILLLEVCEALWARGVDFDLHFVGRVNPHFGRPLEKRIRQAMRTERRVHWQAAADDAELGRLYAEATLVALPTLAEGCGLPLREALWRGVPCLASDLPVLRESAAGGGCVLAAVNDRVEWEEKLRALFSETWRQEELRTEMQSRLLPCWRDTAQALCELLG